VFKRLVDIKNLDYQREATLKNCHESIRIELEKRHEYCENKKMLDDDDMKFDSDQDEIFQEDI